ncbi:MAG: hypothetical protein V4505_27495 [Pseudomonadota bacterium]
MPKLNAPVPPRLCRTLLVALFGFCSGVVHAQNPQLQRELVHDLCDRSAIMVMEKYRPLLSEYPEIFRSKDLVVFSPLIEFNAVARSEQQRVVLTYGMCDRLFLMLRAYGLGSFYHSPLAQLKAYTTYLNSITRKQLEDVDRGQWLEFEILPFELWAKLDLSTLDESARRAIDGSVSEAMGLALSFVIGHEVGHLAHKDKPYNKISKADARIQERNADDFGMTLAMRAVQDPVEYLAFMLPMTIMFDMENYEVPVADNVHPPMGCRLVRAVFATDLFGIIDANPELRQRYSAMMGMSPRKVIEQLRPGLTDPRCTS